MKFALLIWVCTFLHENACMKPIKYPRVFDSWYECSRAAHQKSIKIYSDIGYKLVNEARLATRYMCTAEDII